MEKEIALPQNDELQKLTTEIEALKESESKYKTLFNYSNNAILILDLEGNILDANITSQERYGYSLDEFQALNCRELDVNNLCYDVLPGVDSITYDKFTNVESEHILRNGTRIPVELNMRLIDIDEQKQVMVIAKDISNRKAYEKQLENEREFLHAIMDNIPDTIYFKDTESRFIKINKAQASLLGLSNCEEAIGKTDFEFFTQAHAEQAFKDEQEMFKTRKPLISKTEKIRVGSGLDKWVTATKVPIIDKYGNVNGLVGVSRDISDLKEAENKIIEYTRELQYLNASKDKFFSIIAHDLKNPFISLLGFSEILVNEYDELTNDERKEYIENIFSASRNSFQLLDNLLQWSRSQTGRIDYCPDEIDLQKIIEECFKVLLPTALNKRINLINDVKQPTTVYADRDMIMTVIRNLITNALKFTNTGGSVKVSTRRNEGYLEVKVEDTGIGMDKESAEKLFRIDVHHSTSGTSNESGTGLGLILCKEFVEKNGGKIWFNSEFGKGSSFNFSLPEKHE